MDCYGLVGRLHEKLVFDRRAKALAERLSRLIPDGASVLDIGCGNGVVDALIMDRLPETHIRGVEVLKRPGCKVECDAFDGRRIPFGDSSFDVCMLIDVLHHTPQIEVVLEEAARASRRLILIKDHLSENIADSATLRFMDWIGNRPHGVKMTYNYLSRKNWEDLFGRLGLKCVGFEDRVGLYPPVADMFFGRGLHFIALLEKGQKHKAGLEAPPGG